MSSQPTQPGALLSPEAEAAAIRANVANAEARLKELGPALRAGNVKAVESGVKNFIGTARDNWHELETWLVRFGTGAFTALSATSTINEGKGKVYSILAGGVAFAANEIAGAWKKSVPDA